MEIHKLKEYGTPGFLFLHLEALASNKESIQELLERAAHDFSLLEEECSFDYSFL